MNLDKKIIHIKTGTTMVKKGLSLDELKQYSKKDENGKPIILDRGTEQERFDLIDEQDKLPQETVRNVVLTCLDNYIISENKEGWQVNNLGIIFSDDKTKEVALKDKYWKLLTKVLDKCTVSVSVEKEGEKEVEMFNKNGVYFAWIIAQVKNELGLLELDEDYEDVESMKKSKITKEAEDKLNKKSK